MRNKRKSLGKSPKEPPLPRYKLSSEVMDYNQVIEMDWIQLDDCVEMYEKKHMCSIVNDGKLINFERRED